MATDCLISNGRPLQCLTQAGISNIWFANYTRDAVFTFNATNVVTGVTSANTAYIFEQNVQKANFQMPGVHAEENGAVSRDNILSVMFFDLNADLLNTIRTLERANLTAYIESAAGTTYVIGSDRPGVMTASEGGLGQNLTDLNGLSADFTWHSREGIFVMDSTLLGTSITVST